MSSYEIFKVIFFYGAGTALILFQVLMMQLLGICLTEKHDETQYSFIVGYVVYSFLVAAIGIPANLLQLNRKIFIAGMFFILIAICIYIGVNIKKGFLKINKETIIKYVKNNWILYVGAIFITFYTISHVQWKWANESSDGGYYIGRIGTYAYSNSYYSIYPDSGLKGGYSLSYLLTTYEMEASFYVFITRMPATLYARLFLSLLNYFLILNSIFVLLKRLFYNFKNKLSDNVLQLIIILVFITFVMNTYSYITGWESTFVQHSGFFGSVLSRNCVPYLCLAPLIFFDKLDLKKILLMFMICIVGVSKSSVSIPILMIYILTYLFIYLLKHHKLLIVPYILVLYFIGKYLGNLYGLDSVNVILQHGGYHLFSLFVVSIIFILLFDYKSYYAIMFILLPYIVLSIPNISNLVYYVTQYQFVLQRAIYGITQSVYVIGCTFIIYILVLVLKHVIENIKVISKYTYKIGIIFLSCSIAFSYGYNVKNGTDGVRDPITVAKVYVKNPYIVPQSTYLLAKSLERYYYAFKIQPKVIMSPGNEINGFTSLSAAMIHTFAPHCISVIGGVRISNVISSNDEFNGFTIDDLQIYIEFANNPNEETCKKLMELNKKYPFNCIVGYGWGETHYDLLTSYGYNFYDVVIDEPNYMFYHIFVRS